MTELQKNSSTEREGKHDFVVFEKRARDVTVKTVGEVVRQVAKAPLHDLGLVAMKVVQAIYISI